MIQLVANITNFAFYRMLRTDFIRCSLKSKYPRVQSIIYMLLDLIVEEAGKAGLDKFVSGQQIYFRILEKRTKDDPIKNQGDITMEQLSIELPIDIKNQDEVKLKSIVTEVLKKNKSEIDVQYSKKIGVGNSLPNYGQVKKVFEEGTSELSSKPGQVLLIDVWATWCGPCQKPMAHNQEMLQKNNWGDKVKIVGVSVDDDAQTIKTRVTTKGWNKIEHLTLGGWLHDHPLIKDFQIQGIPFIALVDTKGYIVYSGHPSSIKLQDKINELLTQSQDKKQSKDTQGQSSQAAKIQEGEVGKLVATIGNRDFFKENFEKVDFICTKMQLRASALKGKVSHVGEVEVYVYEADKKIIEQCEKLLPSKAIKLKSHIVQTVTVPKIAQACSECNSKLQYPLYWCKWSANPTDFRCLACVDKKIDQKTYSYKQNSILLMGPIQVISKKKIGNNVQPASGLEQLDPHSFGCNGGCGAGGYFKVGEGRFICLGCRSEPNHRGDHIDLCQQCIKKYINKDEGVTAALANDGHQPNHPFLKVLYNVNGYYDY